MSSTGDGDSREFAEGFMGEHADLIFPNCDGAVYEKLCDDFGVSFGCGEFKSIFLFLKLFFHKLRSEGYW